MSNLTNAVYRRLSDNAGKIFLIKDFEDLASQSSIRSTLSRLTRQGKIYRALNGLYYKPDIIPFISMEVTPSPIYVAHKIAEKNNWTITVSGDEALNKTGLDTQMVNDYIYHTDGKSCEYIYDGRKITFKHVDKRLIHNLSKEFAIFLQALNELSFQHLSEPKVLNQLVRFEKQYLKEECFFDTKYQFPSDIVKKLKMIKGFKHANIICR